MPDEKKKKTTQSTKLTKTTKTTGTTQRKNRRKDEYQAPSDLQTGEKSEIVKIMKGIAARDIKDKGMKLELKREELEQVLERAKKERKGLRKSEKEKKELENIEEVLEERKALAKKEMLRINERLFFNLAAASLILAYFIYINYLHHHIELSGFLRIVRLFSAGFLGITILLFEVAYHKDSGNIAIVSIEFLILSIATLMLLYIQSFWPDKLCSISISIAICFSIYYAVKSLVIYIKRKRAYCVKKMKKEIEKE